MKKIGFVLALLFSLNSCNVDSPTLENCIAQEITVTKIEKDASNNMILKDAGTDYFYLKNRLENGLQLEELKTQLLNKKVTLHLPKYWIGTSENIAQLTINDEIIYSKFKNTPQHK